MKGIIVCDDDSFMLKISAELAEKAIKSLGLNTNVICKTCDYTEVIKFVAKNQGPFLYFLDYDFGKNALNGIDIGKVIKENNPLSKIVYVTSHTDTGFEILKSGVEPYGFIEKTTDINKMSDEYKKYIVSVFDVIDSDTDENSVRLLIGIDEYVSFTYSRILYIEASKVMSHFIVYHTVDGSEVSVRDSIENALSALGSGFMKSHRSVIINKTHVVNVEDGLVKFANGETAACSFRLKKDVIKNCL